MIPLHIHSNYSFLEGAVSLENLISKAKEYGLSSLALTDTNGMYGLISFAKKCAEVRMKAILGAYIDEPKNPQINCILLAKNNIGYTELCKVITQRRLNNDFNLVSCLNGFFNNLIVISSSVEILKSLNRKDLYAELISTSSKKNQNRSLYELSKSLNIKCVVTNPVYFLNRDDFIIHKILTAIKLNKNFDNLLPNEIVDEEYYFKAPSEIEKKWKSLPNVLSNISEIINECNVDLKLNEYKFPSFPLPKNETPFSYLHKISFEGLERRYKPITEKAISRLNFELSVIDELRFSEYFLVVWDIVQEAKRRGMITIGRGSAANSIVSYCLGLTDVDPIKYNLYFERFLNKGRSSPPDVDIDFSWKERDEVIRYVFEKYGYENVAMISTHVTFRARSAFREVAKTFGISNEEISKYSKFIPWTNAENLPKLSKIFPEAKNLKLDIEPWKTIVNIATKIANFPRHLSIHPGGIVIAPKPITNFTALEYAKNKGLGLIITQPDMYGIEDLGLVKIDLLSQRSLGVLRDTLNVLNKSN